MEDFKNDRFISVKDHIININSVDFIYKVDMDMKPKDFKYTIYIESNKNTDIIDFNGQEVERNIMFDKIFKYIKPFKIDDISLEK